RDREEGARRRQAADLAAAAVRWRCEMKSAIVVVAALCAAPLAAEAAPWDGTPTMRAMKDELARSMDKLELEGSGKPYYLSYQLTDAQHVSVRASFGALESSDSRPRRTLDIDLRVGDYTYDNSNFGDRDRGRSISLGSDDDYDVVR